MDLFIIKAYSVHEGNNCFNIGNYFAFVMLTGCNAEINSDDKDTLYHDIVFL